MTWDDLESELDPQPEFYVQAPDGVRGWSEDDRQATLFTLMHNAAPLVAGHHIANEGKRSPYTAKRKGIVAGVFDTRWDGKAPLTAAIEFKGYDKRGRPGEMSTQQIEWGNRMHRMGHHVACFFCPYAAVDWLRGLGFPVAAVRRIIGGIS